MQKGRSIVSKLCAEADCVVQLWGRLGMTEEAEQPYLLDPVRTMQGTNDRQTKEQAVYCSQLCIAVVGSQGIN
jgi:hypothetical protein